MNTSPTLPRARDKLSPEPWTLEQGQQNVQPASPACSSAGGAEGSWGKGHAFDILPQFLFPKEGACDQVPNILMGLLYPSSRKRTHSPGLVLLSALRSFWVAQVQSEKPECFALTFIVKIFILPSCQAKKGSKETWLPAGGNFSPKVKKMPGN